MRTSWYVLLILFVVVISGCKDKPKPQQMPAVSGQPGAAVTSQPATTQQAAKVEEETYTYDAKDRRDPFVPLLTDVKEKPLKKKGASPFEEFDVEEIKLIAIAWDSKQYYAMITLPDKKSYTIRKGMTLGVYGGRVEEITKNSVLIREQVKDYKGQTKTRDTILKLRKEGEE